MAATTLAKLGQASVPVSPAITASPAVTPATRTIRLAAVVLSAACRDRWITDWTGELHALPTGRERLGFVLDILAGLPNMAILISRTDPR